jgi:hypothetical protein
MISAGFSPAYREVLPEFERTTGISGDTLSRHLAELSYCRVRRRQGCHFLGRGLRALSGRWAGSRCADGNAWRSAFDLVRDAQLLKEQQRGIVQPFIIEMQIFALILFARSPIGLPDTFATHLWTALPPLLLGTSLGALAFQRVGGQTFREAILLLLILSGLAMLL